MSSQQIGVLTMDEVQCVQRTIDRILESSDNGLAMTLDGKLVGHLEF